MIESPDMSPEEFDDIDRLADDAIRQDAAAQKGPWKIATDDEASRYGMRGGIITPLNRQRGTGLGEVIWDGADGASPDDATLAWIADARSREPQLAAEVKTLRRLLRYVESRWMALPRDVHSAVLAYRLGKEWEELC